jgi:hypothetical protein
MPQIEYHMCDDGDYVFLISWDGDEFTIHQAWLVPGTELED